MTNRISRHWLLWGVSGLVIASLVFALADDSPAQAKKDPPKTKTKTKDAKSEPLPANYPKRIDFIDPSQGGTEHVTLIDDHILKLWKENKTYPSDRCTDYEFIRRASLDIIGRIPTVKEISDFMKQPEKTRRSWLINAFLDGPEYGNGREYAQNFANMWTVFLMTRSGSGKHYQDQMNDWLYEQFKGTAVATAPPPVKEKTKDKTKAKTVDSSASSSTLQPESTKVRSTGSGEPNLAKMAHALISGEGETNRNAYVNYLLHNLGDEFKQDQNKNGKWDMVPATSRTTRLFLGTRTQCVQCHDHPFNGEWGQHHFWGINAFFRQVDTNGRPAMMVAKKKKGEKGNQEYNVKDRTDFNSTNLVGYERRNTVYLFTDPSYLNGKKIPKDFKGTRRDALAKFITEDPLFAKAMVNRMWGHFFGKSFTKDNPDDFGEHNPISHPELLDKLSEDFAQKYGHNPKVLIRWICNSQAYGLSSKANKWNDKTEDETLFARMLLKPMSPEVMFASVTVATHSRWNMYSEEKKAAKLADGEKWYKKLIDNFGNDEGEEGSYSGTVVQALLLMNGQDINAAIADPKEGTVEYIKNSRGASMKSLPAAINDIFLHTLSRPASPKELSDMMSPAVFNFRPGSKTAPNTPQFWTNYYQDVIWALLNSNEFILNH